jgi:hypothetical protein
MLKSQSAITEKLFSHPVRDCRLTDCYYNCLSGLIPGKYAIFFLNLKEKPDAQYYNNQICSILKNIVAASPPESPLY